MNEETRFQTNAEANHEIIQDAALKFLSTQCVDGAFPPEVGAKPNALTTAEVLCALSELKHPWLEELRSESVDVLLCQQCADGSWTDPNSKDPWDVSSTAWTIWALAKTAGEISSKDAQDAGLSWMASLILPSGGLPTNALQTVPNTYATAYALRAFHAADWVDSVESCQRFLSTSQNPNGGWGLHVGAHSDSTLTEYVLHGLADGGLKHTSLFKRGIDWLVSKRSSNGTWGSWLDEEISVEGTAFGLYVLAKAGRRFGKTEDKSLAYIAQRVRSQNPWHIGDSAQVWIAVSGLLAAWASSRGRAQ